MMTLLADCTKGSSDYSKYCLCYCRLFALYTLTVLQTVQDMDRKSKLR